MQYHLENELFQIDVGREWIVYAPLKRIAFRANGLLVNLLCDIQDGVAIDPESCGEALAKLQECGVLAATHEESPSRGVRDLSEEPFQPVNLTLFLTSDCNLACRYCYGDGGARRASMPMSVGLAAIDVLFRNARRKGAHKVHLGFHGGGEPTLRMDTLKRLVRHARRLAHEHKIDLALGLTSNGVMPEEAARWIACNIHQLNISLDGPGAMQDFQRPMRNGAGSSERVARTLRILEEQGTPYHLRGTVTRISEERIPEIVSYLTGKFSPASIQLEPMFSSSRAEKAGIGKPDEGSFVRGFLAAGEIARKKGIRLHFSGDRFPAISSRFCSIGWETFAVTPEGRATACFEVLREEDSRSKIFFFGTFSDGHGFSFQPDRIRHLRVLSETELPHCRDCFAKFHCAGDCRAKGLYPDSRATEVQGTSRCRIIQALTKARLVELLESVPLVRLENAGEAPNEC